MKGRKSAKVIFTKIKKRRFENCLCRTNICLILCYTILKAWKIFENCETTNEKTLKC